MATIPHNSYLFNDSIAVNKNKFNILLKEKGWNFISIGFSNNINGFYECDLIISASKDGLRNVFLSQTQFTINEVCSYKHAQAYNEIYQQAIQYMIKYPQNIKK